MVLSIPFRHEQSKGCVPRKIEGKEKRRGQTLVEYGLILALVSILIISVLTVLGSRIDNVFNSITATPLHTTQS